MVALLPTLIQLDRIMPLLNKAIASATKEGNMDLLQYLVRWREELHQILVHPEAIAKGTIQMGDSIGRPVEQPQPIQYKPVPELNPSKLPIAIAAGATGNIAMEFTLHNGKVIPTNRAQWITRINAGELTIHSFKLLFDNGVISPDVYNYVITNASPPAVSIPASNGVISANPDSVDPELDLMVRTLHGLTEMSDDEILIEAARQLQLGRTPADVEHDYLKNDGE